MIPLRVENTLRVMAAATAAEGIVTTALLAAATGIGTHDVKEAVKLLLYRKCLVAVARGQYRAVPGAVFTPRHQIHQHWDATALVEAMLPLTLPTEAYRAAVARANAAWSRRSSAPAVALD